MTPRGRLGTIQLAVKNTWKQGGAMMLRFIGIVLFLWILSRIDASRALTIGRQISLPTFAASFALILAIYAVKALRWHLLVASTGATATYRDSWRLFNIGVFLGTITPARSGELLRAAYLRRAGTHGGTAVTLILLERFADVAITACLTIGGVLLLFGKVAFFWTASGTAIAGIAALLLWKLSQKTISEMSWLQFLAELKKPRMLALLGGLSLLSWILYFGWATLLARAVAIPTPIPVLISVLTIAGIVSLLPIAPVGLGTREIALVTLLAPYGVPPEHAIALGLLMFLSILLSSIPGGFIWLTSSARSRAGSKGEPEYQGT